MLIVRKRKAYVPTMAKTEAGFYLGMEPIEVVDTADRQDVENAVMRAIATGNPVMPTPSRDNYTPDPLLKSANVKSLSTFEKSAQRWQLTKRQGAYEIVPYKLLPNSEPLPVAVHRFVERALGRRN